MTIPRIYYTDDLQTGVMVKLSPTASQHLIKVLRLQIGAPIILFNGQGGQYQAQLTEINNRTAIATVGQFQEINTESPLKIHLGQVIARGQKMDFIIQKAVELGVTEITPLTSTRCGVQLPKDRLKKRHLHWQGVIISACEQCGRNIIPTCHKASTIDNWLTTQGQHTQLNLILAPQNETLLTQVKPRNGCITLLIGPEGGLTDDEIQLACQHHFTPIKLGPRILRTETAGLAVIAVTQSLWGDLITTQKNQ